MDGHGNPVDRIEALCIETTPRQTTLRPKVGTETIDNSIYREQYEMNHIIDAQSRAKNSGGPAPFASDYVCPPDGGATRYPHDFVLQPRERDHEPTGKVGKLAAFDPEVYANQRAANHELAEARRVKTFGSAFWVHWSVVMGWGGGCARQCVHICVDVVVHACTLIESSSCSLANPDLPNPRTAGTPFATSNQFDELRRRDYYHAKPKKGGVTPGAKVCDYWGGK